MATLPVKIPALHQPLTQRPLVNDVSKWDRNASAGKVGLATTAGSKTCSAQSTSTINGSMRQMHFSNQVT